jgi:FKBP-type peptidyl-prolyl cis-trans isomerase
MELKLNHVGIKYVDLKPLLILVFFISVTSCHYFDKYPGYSPAGNGIYYKLLRIGEETPKAKATDYVTVDLEYKTIDDSVFFKGRRKFQVAKPAYKGSIDECLTMLTEEESAEFIIPAYPFYSNTLQSSLPDYIKPTEDMKIKIDMVEIQTRGEYQKEKEAFLKWINDFGEYEKVILKQYIDEQNMEIEATNSGIFHLTLQKGKGKKVEKGDTVTVHFEGRFLNGKFFDSTKKRNQPFQFVYGQEWQVIEGLERAIGMMQEGEKSLFILPSELAFGETGSSTGIIPPYTSLIFEVELEKIN